MMPHTISDTRETPAVRARLLVLCLAAVFVLCSMLAEAQDHRWQVTINEVAQLGPSAACFATATCDTKRGSLIIMGGYDPPSKDAPRTLLKYDLGKRAWSKTELADPSPDAIGKPALVYDPKRDALFLFGGWALGVDKPSAQLWTMLLADGKSPAWQLVDVGGNHPPARNGCVMVLDLQRDRLLVHGGDGGTHPTYGYTPLDDLWAFDLAKQQWSRLKPTGQSPQVRWNHAGAVDHKNGKMFVFGGVGYAGGRLVRDIAVFELNLEKLSWTKHAGRGDSPITVQGATMTYDTSAQVLVVVGGLSVADTGPPGSKSLWLFDLKTKTWAEYPDVFSTTRRDHSAIYDPRSRQHVVHGGHSTKERGNYYIHGKPLRDTLTITITASE